ncbi:MAG: alpha/beta hydrolase [Chloroflexota bacterium]
MDTVVSKDGTAIAFDHAGTGPVVILVGGAFWHRSFPNPNPQDDPLEQDFTVVTYDRRGRGDSGDTLPYAIEREIEDIAALIEAFGGSAFVFGMSSGAVLSLEAAARGLPIKKLALYEPPFIVDDSRPPVPSDYVHQLNAMVAAGRRGDAVEYFMTKAVGMPAEFVTPMRDMPMWPAFEAVAHTLAYDGTIIGDTMSGNPLPTDRWSSVTIPTLVMDGSESPAYQQNGVHALVDILPNAQRHTLAGQTHDVSLAALAPALAAFY